VTRRRIDCTCASDRLLRGV